MRVLIQRVREAKVIVEGGDVAGIGKGFLLLVGIGKNDTLEDIERMAKKTVDLRLFDDEKGKINLNIKQINGQILSVPQFTLYADTHKGNRPGLDLSAGPKVAQDYWKRFNDKLRELGISVKEGIFGAHMAVSLTNDGPVTIWLDSRKGGG